MIARYAFAVFVSLAWGLFAAGCASEPESSSKPFDLEAPASTDVSSGDDTSSSSGESEPRRFEAGHFDWAPDDTPVVLHTVEESRATKEQWADLRRPEYVANDDPDFGFEAITRIDPTEDIDLSDLRPHLEQFMQGPMLEPFRKGDSLFAGFGDIFEIDGALHLFECRPGSHDAIAWPDHEKDKFKTGAPHWTVGDVVVTCEWSDRRWPHLQYFVRRDDGGKGYDEDFFRVEASDEQCRSDSVIPIPSLPRVPNRFAKWWKETVESTISQRKKFCGITNRYDEVHVPIFFWVPSSRNAIQSVRGATQGFRVDTKSTRMARDVSIVDDE